MGRVRLVRGTVVLLGVAVLLFVCAVAPSPGACLSVTDPGWEDVDVNALSDEELALLLGDLTDHGEEEPEDDDEDDADDEDDDDSRDRDALAMTEEVRAPALSPSRPSATLTQPPPTYPPRPAQKSAPQQRRLGDG